MKLNKPLTALALTLALSLSACTDEPEAKKQETPVVSKGADEVEAANQKFATETARAYLSEKCAGLKDEEVGEILGVDLAALKWTVDFTEEDFEGAPACQWTINNGDVEAGNARQLFVKMEGPANQVDLSKSTNALEIPNVGTASWLSPKDPTLYVSPEGTDYELSFSVTMPMDGTAYQQYAGFQIATAQAAEAMLNN